jgi:hypothetical protein
MKEFESIEKWLEEESVENKKWIEEDEDMDEDYKEEMLMCWDWDRDGDKEIYYLGLGDEEVKYFVGMEEEVYKKWEKGLDEGSEDWSWNDVDDRKIYELINELVF